MSNAPSTSNLSETLLLPEEAALYLKVSRRTLENYRWRGEGPAFVRLGKGRSGRVRYRKADLDLWLGELRTSTVDCN